MADITTSYLGLKLRNPLVVSSSGLTSSVEKLKHIEASGAGAVVLKSVFEEQILNETTHLETSGSSEEADYLQFYLKEDYLGKYVDLISEAKMTLSIPVIASISCINSGEWISFAQRLEAAGADALELNIFVLPIDKKRSGESIEMHYLSIVKEVVSVVKIPVSVKIGSRFTNILSIVGGIEACGAKGVVMFNRFYEPDINIETLSIKEADIFSSSAELRNSIRWIAMSSSQFPNLDLAASTGIHTGEDAVKVLLAGASVYEVCSVIYEQGLGVISQINGFVTGWMNKKGFKSLDEVIGKVNYTKVSDHIGYERAQFMKYFATRE